MSYDERKVLRKHLDKINHRKDMRRSAKEANDEGFGSSMVNDIATGTIAHWAEQILQEYYGSSNYGYTITATQHNERIVLSGMGRNSPVLMRDAGYEYSSEVGFADEGNLREYKNRAADWFEDQAVRVADEALDKIRRIEEQQMMR